MDATEAEKQIEQMCRFIEQEAKEKVDEITMKTDQDHDKEEQTLLVEGRINLKAEFEKKMKELSVRKRMYVNVVSSCLRVGVWGGATESKPCVWAFLSCPSWGPQSDFVCGVACCAVVVILSSNSPVYP